MTSLAQDANRRILVIDDARSIHEDIRKVLAVEPALVSELSHCAAALFDDPLPADVGSPGPQFAVDSAFQGKEGLELVLESLRLGRPYAIAFIDMRMPPGWDGVETACRIRERDPDVQIVICTAYADYSWGDIAERLGTSDGLLILKKPFENIELLQLAHALSEKWALHHAVAHRLEDLEALVVIRTGEQADTNARLARSEANFRTLVEQSPDAMFVEHGAFIRYVNPVMARLLGYDDAEELCGVAAEAAFVHLADRARLADHVHRADAGEPVGSIRLRWVKRGGGILTIEAKRSNIIHDGEPAVMVMARDITERLRLETEREEASKTLRRSEERYRVLFENSPLAKLVFDPESLDLVAVNLAATQLYGYTSAEILSLRIVDLKVPEVPPLGDETPGRSRTDEWCGSIQPGTAMRRHLRKDGSLIDVDVTIHPLVLEGRGAMLASCVDGTETLRLEEQLRQGQKMEAIGRLAGGVAHDFNNLLTAILGYTDLVLGELLPGDRMREDLEEVRRAGLAAADLTRQLLAFSRQQILEPTIIDLKQVVAGMENMLRRLLGEGMELTLHVMEGLGQIYADRGQVQQVIVNLLVNARDAAPRGKVTVSIENVDLDATRAPALPGVVVGPYVMVAVSDNGIGMDKATQAHIFEPFFTTKQLGKGTGLGLSTVLGIVQQSGGHISVDSVQGEGTTFKVYLPRTDRPAAPASATLQLETTSHRGSETILVVEDTDQVRHIVETILRRRGYDVLSAANAGEALLICEQYPGTIHLLLTDVVMPRMSGRELVKRLAPIRPQMKVLYMSGHTEDTILTGGIREAAIAFLQKPISPDALTRKVRDVLAAA